MPQVLSLSTFKKIPIINFLPRILLTTLGERHFGVFVGSDPPGLGAAPAVRVFGVQKRRAILAQKQVSTCCDIPPFIRLSLSFLHCPTLHHALFALFTCRRLSDFVLSSKFSHTKLTPLSLLFFLAYFAVLH